MYNNKLSTKKILCTTKDMANRITFGGAKEKKCLWKNYEEI
jgi:hypothetical protein